MSNKVNNLKVFFPLIAIFSLAIVFTFAYQFYMGYLTWVFPVNDNSIPVANEAVMTPKMQITVNSRYGPITIVAGNGLKRTFYFDGATRSIEMYPRKTPYFGNMGLYYTGPGFHWLPVNGIVRCVAIEGVLNFPNLDKTIDWLSQKPAEISRLYRNDGLCIWISKRDGTLGVDIFQIYINGKKPNKLTGACDSDIIVRALKPIPDTTKTLIFNENMQESSEF